MFLAETLRSDLFLAQSNLTALRAACLNECNLQRLVGISINNAVDSISRRRWNRTCFLTRYFELDSELGTYKEVIELCVTIHGEQRICLLYLYAVSIKFNRSSSRCCIVIQQSVLCEQSHAVVNMLATERQTLTGFNGLLFFLGVLVFTRLFLQPFV